MKNEIRREMARPWTWERLRDSARHNRSRPTDAEDLLWSALRRRPGGFKFRRQYAIDRFIVDFYCVKAQLVIEVDGPIHEYKRESDSVREEHLKTRGLKSSVLQTSKSLLISLTCSHKSRPSAKHPSLTAPSPRKERGSEGEVCSFVC